MKLAQQEVHVSRYGDQLSIFNSETFEALVNHSDIHVVDHLGQEIPNGHTIFDSTSNTMKVILLGAVIRQGSGVPYLQNVEIQLFLT